MTGRDRRDDERSARRERLVSELSSNEREVILDTTFVIDVLNGDSAAERRRIDRDERGDGSVSAVTGTHEVEFMGIEPMGREADVSGMAFSRFEDGKVREDWASTTRSAYSTSSVSLSRLMSLRFGREEITD